MHIVFVGYGSGIATYLNEACDWLARQGHQVDVLYPVLGSHDPKIHAELTRHPNISLHSAEVGNLHYYFAKLRLPMAFKIRYYEMSHAISKKLFDIKYIKFDLAELINGLAYSTKTTKLAPFIYKLHGADWMMRHYCEEGSWSQFEVVAHRQMLRRAQQVHALSRSQAAFVAGACKFPPSLIYVTPLPINTKLFVMSSRSSVKPPWRLMFVGRLERRKGIHTLVEALRQVWQKEPETHLYLYGSNGDFGESQIEAFIPYSEHQGRVHFEGVMPRSELISQYQQADLYVAPTRYETFGYTILEAMACGCPVIATDIGPIPEIVRHEETGWLVPRDNSAMLAEAILFALQHSELRRACGRAARKLAEYFDTDVIMPRQFSLYEQALKTK